MRAVWTKIQISLGYEKVKTVHDILSRISQIHKVTNFLVCIILLTILNFECLIENHNEMSFSNEFVKLRIRETML